MLYRVVFSVLIMVTIGATVAFQQGVDLVGIVKTVISQ